MKGYSVSVLVDLDEIDDDLLPARHMRAELNQEAIDEYVGILDMLDPVKLVQDRAGHHWVADGAHTITAARRAKRKQIKAIVRRGSYQDAWKDAAVANDGRGLRITNADKRHRVEVALADPEMRQWSNRRIAEWCAVSDFTVRQIRPEPELRENRSSDPPKTIGRDGKARRAPAPREPKERIPYVESTPRRERPIQEPPVPRGASCDEQDPSNIAGPSREEVAGMFGGSDASLALEPDRDSDDQAFDHESAWERVERFVLSQFEEWPDEFKVVFKESFDSLGWRIGDMTPGWTTALTVEVESD